MNLNDLSTQLLFTTVPIWTESLDGRRASATAFLFNAPVPGKPDHSLPLLVTNHHVVANAKRAVVEIVERDGDRPNRTKRVRVELPTELLLAHSSDVIDIAVIAMGAALNELERVGRPAFFRSVSAEIIPSSEALGELAAMEEVVFIGYPSGLRDEINATPLIRRGITSTPVWNDYDGKPAFLIDAGVFPGSSGSPVFIVNQGAYSGKNGIVIGSRLYFLGMISQSIIRTDSGSQFFLGLGEVINCSAVHRFISEAVLELVAR